mmetsp:Transcript_26806/g.31636  ORF Transcript_26806/g.31636 Transcript_26806/m.31636 type:complete len:130 (+) Transcript_26806:471-860(+)
MVVAYASKHIPYASSSLYGNARVFKWNEDGGCWKIRGNGNGELGGEFKGESISLSKNGDVVAVGSPKIDGKPPGYGRVRVYEWNGGQDRWMQQGGDIIGDEITDYTGSPVSLSTDGTVVAIGALNNDGD